jgi:hypothetical membrane protein
MGLPRVNLICFIAPIIALIAIAVAILLSPAFNWYANALSDLGHYTRVDIGPHPLRRALIFNVGLILTGLLMLYYVQSLIRRLKDQPTRISMIPFGIACLFLIAIGVFSENFNPIHYYVSVGFFFSFPWAMWILGLAWVRFPRLRWFAVLSLAMPFASVVLWWGTFVGRFAWSGVAIPELLTALTAIGWVWIVNLLDISKALGGLMK